MYFGNGNIHHLREKEDIIHGDIRNFFIFSECVVVALTVTLLLESCKQVSQTQLE